jgi:lipoprotein-anchoring transpeptidase ErfK/SrfK
MQRTIIAGLASVLGATSASAQYVAPQPYARQVQAPPPMVVVAQPPQVDLGGGFIEFVFGGQPQQPRYAPPPPPRYYNEPGQGAPAQIYANSDPAGDPSLERAGPPMDPRYLRQDVDYSGTEAPGTIVIDTPNKFLYLVQPGGRALRYGIGVGRPGFTWSGTHAVSAKKEWPDWTPPDEMLQRQPYLPHFMPGGPNNPLGARALYLGSTLYRIHGSNEPWTIGQNVSSGCIRMRNADVIDLYTRVKVGTKVVVM